MAQERNWFAEGIELFNAGRFFECHEAWEEEWKRSHGEARRFYQGLIQLAVAILHRQRGNRQGASSVYEKARRNLAGLPDDYMGVALERLRREAAAFMEEEAGNAPLPHLGRSSWTRP